MGNICHAGALLLVLHLQQLEQSRVRTRYSFLGVHVFKHIWKWNTGKIIMQNCVVYVALTVTLYAKMQQLLLYFVNYLRLFAKINVTHHKFFVFPYFLLCRRSGVTNWRLTGRWVTASDVDETSDELASASAYDVSSSCVWRSSCLQVYPPHTAAHSNHPTVTTRIYCILMVQHVTC